MDTDGQSAHARAAKVRLRLRVRPFACQRRLRVRVSAARVPTEHMKSPLTRRPVRNAHLLRVDGSIGHRVLVHVSVDRGLL